MDVLHLQKNFQENFSYFEFLIGPIGSDWVRFYPNIFVLL